MPYLSDLRVHSWNGRNVIPPYYVSLYTFRIWQQYNLISGNDSGFCVLEKSLFLKMPALPVSRCYN